MDKFYVAREQLITALELFFDDRSPVSVHTLAGAAQEILEVCCRRIGIKPFMTHIEKTHTNKTQNQLRRIIYHYRNALKHFRDDDSEILADFSDEKNDHMLIIAIYDYMNLSGGSTIPMQVFMAWYYSVYPEKLSAGTDLEHFTKIFPDVRGKPRALQKRLAQKAIATLLHDKELMNDPRTEV